MSLFSKSPFSIKSKIIFHNSTMALPERQQMGLAELSEHGFELDLPVTKNTPPINIKIPLKRINNLRTFQKKTYSSIFYVVQVDYTDEAGKSLMVSFEIRVFLRRGQALVTVRRWKEIYQNLLARQQQ